MKDEPTVPWQFLPDLCHFGQRLAAVRWVSGAIDGGVMKRGMVLKGGLGLVLLGLAGFIVWVLFLPPAPAASGPLAIENRVAGPNVAAL